MTSTGETTDTQDFAPATVDLNLEVVTIAVTDVDRAKRFYRSLGWRLDADIVAGDSFRVVQLTPPHSQCSVAFGKGVTTASPGSAQRLLLVVSDITAARDELVGRGIDVGEIYHLDGGPSPGSTLKVGLHEPANFSDPDGNGWVLQEVRAAPACGTPDGSSSPRQPAGRRESRRCAVAAPAPLRSCRSSAATERDPIRPRAGSGSGLSPRAARRNAA